VKERESERERKKEREREKERKREKREREREKRESVCVCVRERERERGLKFNWVTGELNPKQVFGPGGIRTCVTEALGTDLLPSYQWSRQEVCTPSAYCTSGYNALAHTHNGWHWEWALVEKGTKCT
jgi:hypothetical protein